MANQEATVPEGYMKDPQGRLVPTDQVREIDRTRDDLVCGLINGAKDAQEHMRRFKASAMADIGAFVELSAERYDVKLGGNKGNVTLMSFDGRYKVQRAISEYIVFDEGLQAAKAMIDECIHRWAEGSSTEIKALVEYAFKTDNEGNVSTSRIIGLQRLDIKDEQWRKAMQAITESMQVAGTKSYIRLYERVGDTDKYEPIPLDVAAL